VPDGVKQKIDEGIKAVGHGVAETGKAIGNTAKKVWDSIF